MSIWISAAASCTGTSHIKDGTRRQDAFRCFEIDGEAPVFVALVSDGAGSAARGGVGACIVCRALSDEIRQHFSATHVLPDDEAIGDWFERLRARLDVAAERNSLTRRDFAATAVLAVWTETEFLTAHIGDGAIITRDAENQLWKAASWPHQGEYASMTFFVTDETLKLRIERHDPAVDTLAVFSDGIERLGLDFSDNTPSERFFDPLANGLRGSEALGRDETFSARLAQFLASDRVNERTDDDKTLVLAVRR